MPASLRRLIPCCLLALAIAGVLAFGVIATSVLFGVLEVSDEPTLLLQLLSTGAHDAVYDRSLAAAADLMREL